MGAAFILVLQGVKRWSRRRQSHSLAALTPIRGSLLSKGMQLEGQSIAGKVLVFPTGKGSTVGSYTLYRLKHNGHAPLAILNAECETITAVGCIIAEIPCVDQLPIHEILPGSLVSIDGENVILEPSNHK